MEGLGAYGDLGAGEALQPECPRGSTGSSGEGEAGREWVALGCLSIAFHSINRKFRMPGLGEGSEHGSAAGSPVVLQVLGLCFSPPSVPWHHLGACGERHCLGPRPDSLNEMSRTQESVI